MQSIFNRDFYPTPSEVITQMVNGMNISGQTILEPSAGKGDIVDDLFLMGAKTVLTCETVEDFQAILKDKSTFLKADFLTVTKEETSHVNAIVMNPPFSKGCEHILHAWKIAPDGCQIVALCNSETIKSRYTEDRRRLFGLIESHGSHVTLGNCFAEAERRTEVSISMIRMEKPANDYHTEFNGFFLDDDNEDRETEGILPYDAIRDLVNRYVLAVKLFDKQIELGCEMNQITSGFFGSALAFTCSEGNKVVTRSTYKKDLQKSGWKWVFDKLNLQKHTTQGLREDINKFIEEQEHIPFTMKNIYGMLETIIGTTGQRMEKALVEVFDKLTQHYDENRHHVEGWKTNSHYLINQKFILPYMVELGWSGEMSNKYSGNFEYVEDMLKALCYMTGDNYDTFETLSNTISYQWKVKDANGKHLNSFRSEDEAHRDQKIRENKGGYGISVKREEVEWGKWFDWSYFECRGYKKGTMHFKFKSEELWAQFNQKVAKAKGYPLYEKASEPKPRKQRTQQAEPTGTAQQEVLFEISL